MPGDAPAAIDDPDMTAASAVGSRAFWYLTAAFVLSSFAISAVAVHLIPYLLEAERSTGFAAFAAGLMGVMQAVLAATTSAAGVVAAVSLFGMGNGMATLVRATAIGDAYGPTFYGSIAGAAAACATGARAIAPVAATAVYLAFNGYTPLLWLLVIGSALAALSARQANQQLAPAERPP